MAPTIQNYTDIMRQLREGKINMEWIEDTYGLDAVEKIKLLIEEDLKLLDS